MNSRITTLETLNMTQWKHCAPADGWHRFDQHELLLNAIRDGLSQARADWNCMNVISNFFVWESRKDGSEIAFTCADTEGARLIELLVEPGCAEDYLAPIAARFGLVLDDKGLH
jgi:hypothetical protein